MKFTKDVTKKVYKYLIEDDDLYDTFKDKDITKLKSMDLITVYDKKVKNSLDFIHWKKIIVTNKINMENMKDKYRIYI